MQDVDRFRSSRKIDRPECPRRIAHPYFADARPDRRHRLSVVRVESALDPEKLVNRVVHCCCRKGLEVGLRVSKPDDGLHGKSIAVQTGLCRISHRRQAMRAGRHGSVLGLCSHLNHTRPRRRLQVVDSASDAERLTWVRFPPPATISRQAATSPAKSGAGVVNICGRHVNAMRTIVRRTVSTKLFAVAASLPASSARNRTCSRALRRIEGAREIPHDTGPGLPDGPSAAGLPSATRKARAVAAPADAAVAADSPASLAGSGVDPGAPGVFAGVICRPGAVVRRLIGVKNAK